MASPLRFATRICLSGELRSQQLDDLRAERLFLFDERRFGRCCFITKD